MSLVIRHSFSSLYHAIIHEENWLHTQCCYSYSIDTCNTELKCVIYTHHQQTSRVLGMKDRVLLLFVVFVSGDSTRLHLPKICYLHVVTVWVPSHSLRRKGGYIPARREERLWSNYNLFRAARVSFKHAANSEKHIYLQNPSYSYILGCAKSYCLSLSGIQRVSNTSDMLTQSTISAADVS